VVVNTPAWVRGSSGTSRTPPTDPLTYAELLGSLAGRYASRGPLVYEVWNEPNQRAFWDTPGGPDAAVYTAMLRAAYPRIKQAAPNATVLGGSLAFNDAAYLQAMYAAGAGGAFDGLALHPYSGSHAPDSTADPTHSFTLAIDNAQQILAANGDASKPIWITEMGWSDVDVPDELRATFIQRAVELVRSRPGIAAFCAYTLEQEHDDANYGLVGPAGAPTQTWLAFGRAVATRR
jgi:polysaccharide biosynthesis protein PslG